MKKLTFMLLFLISATFISSLAYGKVMNKRFMESEIKQMANTQAVIKTKFGDIKIKFYPEVAPNHVSSFITLSKEGFYNGTLFHRIVPNFVIQGGDPLTKLTEQTKNTVPDTSKYGTGGPDYNIKAEFNEKSHKRGVLSMARSADPDSAGSQFFICVNDVPFLDRQYTVFGEVVEGMDAVDKIVSQPRDKRDLPIERIEMQIQIIEQK
ncbi:cyclophilin type peptidyl-prolyl cis-trans isomerase [Candidatus Magnetoovum chiemensis]|nr:cyclophilin type peptidyl-prolyl cis-trans isomerase [Candidatus Magnetoovum chiemensis]